MAISNSISRYPITFYQEIESPLGCRIIPISAGRFFALVDSADYDTLIPFAWQFTSDGYASRNLSKAEGDGTVSMHKMLLNVPIGMEIDHANGFKLDNRRKNLRVCTPSQNQGNRLLRVDNNSGFKGVYRPTGRTKFAAQIQIHGKRIPLGRFATAVEAAKAYDRKARELFGAYANLNFPGDADEG